jgi:hypothetical protein
MTPERRPTWLHFPSSSPRTPWSPSAASHLVFGPPAQKRKDTTQYLRVREAFSHPLSLKTRAVWAALSSYPPLPSTAPGRREPGFTAPLIDSVTSTTLESGFTLYPAMASIPDVRQRQVDDRPPSPIPSVELSHPVPNKFPALLTRSGTTQPQARKWTDGSQGGLGQEHDRYIYIRDGDRKLNADNRRRAHHRSAKAIRITGYAASERYCECQWDGCDGMCMQD